MENSSLKYLHRRCHFFAVIFFSKQIPKIVNETFSMLTFKFYNKRFTNKSNKFPHISLTDLTLALKSFPVQRLIKYRNNILISDKLSAKQCLFDIQRRRRVPRNNRRYIFSPS